MLSVRNLHVVRGTRTVLADANVDVAAGEIVVLRGRSGSGKSSLVAAILGEIPSKGAIKIAGHTQPSSTEARATWRGKWIGVVDQETDLLPELTIEENVALPLVLRRDRNSDRAQQLLNQFGLMAIRAQRANQVSGGERQRGAIARGLVTGAKLLLVDEPTSALDEENAKTVIQALQDAANGGAAVLVVSHDDLLFNVGRQLELHDGQIRPCTA